MPAPPGVLWKVGGILLWRIPVQLPKPMNRDLGF